MNDLDHVRDMAAKAARMGGRLVLVCHRQPTIEEEQYANILVHKNNVVKNRNGFPGESTYWPDLRAALEADGTDLVVLDRL